MLKTFVASIALPLLLLGLTAAGCQSKYAPTDATNSPQKIADYLEGYAAELDVEILTNTRVETIQRDGRAFLVSIEDGRALLASGIVAASGSFSNPYRPSFPGADTFTGKLTHVADYRNPTAYADQRVVVVGAGDSAAQVANELAPIATTSIATRHPIRFIPQRIGGHDVHYWFRETGFDSLPPEWLSMIIGGSVVTDSVGFRQTLREGRVDRRSMFVALEGGSVVWSDGDYERVDSIILATGYRPSLEYLRGLGALDATGAPLHVGGISSTHAGLVYVGLEYQRSYASNTLRGVGADAVAVITPLIAWIRDAPSQVGLGH